MSALRLRFILFAVPLMALAALTVAADRSHPDAGVIDPTCTSSSPCIEYDNNGNGAGIKGLSVLGDGLVGMTKFNSTSTANGRPGVFGNDLSTSGTFNSGVKGVSARGTGVFGSSATGAGVIGTSTSTSPSGIGVEGSSAGQFGVAIVADATGDLGTAVEARGHGFSGEGLFASAAGGNGIGIEGDSYGLGLKVETFGTSGLEVADFYAAGSGGDAVIGGSDGVGVLAIGYASASSSVPAINAECAAGAPTITATNYNGGSPYDSMSLDCSGNMILAGTLTTKGTPLVARRGTAGVAVGTFSDEQTTPTIDDLGEAHLTQGQAYVHLASDFAALIDRRANYLVFLTPQGDSNGLYVAQKTAEGFLVREHKGESSIAFDYRIVAKAYSEPLQRLPALRIKMRPDPSMAALVQRAMQSKSWLRPTNLRERLKAHTT